MISRDCRDPRFLTRLLMLAFLLTRAKPLTSEIEITRLNSKSLAEMILQHKFSMQHNQLRQGRHFGLRARAVSSLGKKRLEMRKFMKKT